MSFHYCFLFFNLFNFVQFRMNASPFVLGRNLDSYSMLIVVKYFIREEDYFNLVFVCKKFQETMLKFHYNPISNTKLFPKMQTQYLYSKSDKVIDTVDKHVCWYSVNYSEYLKLKKRGFVCKKVVPSNSCVTTRGDANYIEFGITDLFEPHFYNYLNFNRTKLVIPSSVTRLNTFQYNKDILNELVLPTTIKSLTVDSFQSFNSPTLKSITFSPKISEFKYDVPYWVSLLMKKGGTHCPRVVFTNHDFLSYGLPIPDCVYSLDKSCFFRTNITVLEIPSSVESIRSQCFYGCNISTLILPFTLTQIDVDCMNLNHSFTSVIMNDCKTFGLPIPYSLASLLEKSGTHCTNVILNTTNGLSDYVIPTNITSVGEQCFSSYTHAITIPTNVTSLGNEAFKNAFTPTRLLLPTTIKYIGENCFSDCNNLQSIIIPPKIKDIPNGCFKNCISLTSIEIHENVTSLGIGCFSYCPIKCVKFPIHLKFIGYNCFQYCKLLTSLTLPTSIITIGGGSFSYCNSLREIIIDNGVSVFGSSVFKECASLKSIELPTSLKVMNGSCFSKCFSLTNIIIPDTITFFGPKEFEFCTKLSSIHLPTSLRNIPYGCFTNCIHLKEILLPNKITSIMPEAFKNCHLLKTMDIPTNVSELKYSCFEGCTSLTKVIINGLIRNLEMNCFEKCYSLKSIEFPTTLTELGSGCFKNCNSLFHITVDHRIEVYGSECFFGCHKLDFKQFHIPLQQLPEERCTIV